MSLRKKRLAQLKEKNRDAMRGGESGVILAPMDNQLLITITFLAVFGIMAVFSAGAPEGTEFYHNPAYFAIKHSIFVIIGAVLMLYVSTIDYRKWQNYVMPFSYMTLGLIAATYMPGLSKTDYGATRWISILGFQLQPSEFAKIACILLAASALSQAKSVFDKAFLKNAGLIMLMVVLIFKQPNLSISSLVTLTFLATSLYAGVSLSLVVPFISAAMPLVYMKVMHTPYQLARITGWLNPWADPQGKGYNLIQSWYAIASGGLFGVGFGNSKQKLFWLPFRHTDFIFAVIAEELGFIGCLILIGLFISFIHRGFIIANRAPDLFAKLIAFGITFSIGMQALINISVACGVLPVTGVTLPLISYGGSSIIVTMTMVGILLNISRKRIKRLHHNEI